MPEAVFSPLAIARSRPCRRGRGEELGGGLPPWLADDVSEEQDPHDIPLRRAARNGPVGALPGVIDRPRLPDHGHADLPGVGKVGLDLLGDVARKDARGFVADLLVVHDDPDLAAGLDGVRLLHAGERLRDRLEVLGAASGSSPASPAAPRGALRRGRPRPGPGWAGCLWGLVLVVRRDGVDDPGGSPYLRARSAPIKRVGALHLVVHGLPDVVQQPRPLCDFRVEAQLGGDHPAEERHLERMGVDVLPVGGAVLQLADQLHQLGVHSVDPQVEERLLPGFADRLVHLLGDLLDRLLDARRMDPAVLDQAGKGDPRDLPADRVEPERMTASGVSSMMTSIPVAARRPGYCAPRGR